MVNKQNKKNLVSFLIHIQIYYCAVKANYYRLARVYHPGRVEETEKAMAKEKFAALQQAYSILVNPETKKIYDAGDSNILFPKTTIAAKWEQYVQIVDSADIERARAKYQGSVLEENDVMREIIIGKGSMMHLLNNIPFMRSADQPRIIAMIKDFINTGKVPKIAIRQLRNVK